MTSRKDGPAASSAGPFAVQRSVAAMEKRVVFRSRWLPYALVAPQLAITIVFFFLPAGQAVFQSLQQQDPFGHHRRVRRARQLPRAVRRSTTTSRRSASPRCSRCWWRRSDCRSRLSLAVFADRAIRGAGVYKTLLIWPYAVAPAVAAVLWLFLFNPIARRRRALDAGRSASPGIRCSTAAMRCARRRRRRLEPDLLQLPVLPRRPAVDPEVADRGRGDRRRGAGPALLDDRVPAAVADDVLPARRQHRLRVLRHVRDHRRGDLRRPGQATEILVYKVYKDGFKALDLGSSAAQSVVLMVIVIGLTVVQFRYIERKVQY